MKRDWKAGKGTDTWKMTMNQQEWKQNNDAEYHYSDFSLSLSNSYVLFLQPERSQSSKNILTVKIKSKSYSLILKDSSVHVIPKRKWLSL